MEYKIGDVIAEFKKSDDPDEEYTRKISRLLLVKGRIPANGDWQIVCLDDIGFQREIPERELEANDGHYITGGENIVRYEAGLELSPNTISTSAGPALRTTPYTINLTDLKGAVTDGKVNY